MQFYHLSNCQKFSRKCKCLGCLLFFILYRLDLYTGCHEKFSPFICQILRKVVAVRASAYVVNQDNGLEIGYNGAGYR